MPQHEGLDLPIHDPDTPVVTSADLHSGRLREITEGYTKPTFVRAAMIQLRDLSQAPASAEELLEWTDRELEAVAKACGASALNYEWGLYPVDGRGRSYQRYLPAPNGLGGIIDLPRDHILVAEIDTIRPASEWMPEEVLAERAQHANDAIADGVARYYEKGEYQLFDFKYDPARNARSGPRFEHFVFGAPVRTPDAEPGMHVVDIEPRGAVTGR